MDWWPEAVLGGDLDQWVSTLERWLTAEDLLERGAVDRVRGRPTAGDLGIDHSALLHDVLRTSGAPLVPGARGHEGCGRLVTTCVHYWAWVEESYDEDALERLIRRHRLDWTWYAYDIFAFSHSSAAREAALCVHEDGEPIDAVARRAGAVQSRRSGLRQDLPAAEVAVLTPRGPGQVVGPEGTPDDRVLLRLEEVRPPAADVEEIRQLARTALEDAALSTAGAGRFRRAGMW